MGMFSSLQQYVLDAGFEPRNICKYRAISLLSLSSLLHAHRQIFPKKLGLGRRQECRKWCWIRRDYLWSLLRTGLQLIRLPHSLIFSLPLEAANKDLIVLLITGHIQQASLSVYKEDSGPTAARWIS
jgi:hypothetical protein